MTAEARANRALNTLVDVLLQAAGHVGDGEDCDLFGMGLSSYRDGILLLVEEGLAEITGGVGRCVTAKLTGKHPLPEGA